MGGGSGGGRGVAEWLLHAKSPSVEGLDRLAGGMTGFGGRTGGEWGEEVREEDSQSETSFSDAFSVTDNSEWEGEEGGVWVSVRLEAVPGVTLDDVADLEEGKGRLNEGKGISTDEGFVKPTVEVRKIFRLWGPSSVIFSVCSFTGPYWVSTRRTCLSIKRIHSKSFHCST